MQIQFTAGRRRRPGALLIGALLVVAAALVSAAYVGGAAMRDQAEPSADLVPAVAPSTPSVAPPSPVAAAPEPPVPATRDALISQLMGLLAAPGVTGALSVSIIDEYGRALIDRDGRASLLPASAQKLTTAAAALESLGPDHRFRTTVGATAVPIGGVLAGDVVLVGSGDPALASPLYGEKVYPARPRTPLERLADGIVALGITRIEGDVVGDPRAWPTAPAADGWADRYFYDFDARFVSSLTVDASLDVTYDAEQDDLEILLSRDPVLTAARVLHDLLVQRGVEVLGAARAATATEPATYVLSAVESPPLAELLRHTVQRSDNHMADTILHAVAQQVLGGSTWAEGERAAERALAAFDLDWTRTRLADGSGLSRADRTDAVFLAGLEQAMYASPHAETWATLMAVAGREGTLRGRLRGTPAEGRFTGKTGTLDDVRSIAGTVHGQDGRRYHMAVIGNDLLTAESRANIRTLMDNLALALASDLAGCVETSTPYDPAVHPEPPPRTWACPEAG